VTDAVPDQLATLDAFTARFGRASRTIAWGQSYGGFVTTAIAERHADRIAGSLSLCGLLQGGVANWNSTLDPVFALKTLLAPGLPIPLTGFHSQATAAAAATELTGIVTAAQATPTGRARIALAAALHNIPVWNDPSQKRPGPTDWDAQQANQFPAVLGMLQLPAFNWRHEAESRAGGNMSWNTGVDYAAMLRRSSVRQEVVELYRKAGLPLEADLGALASAPRITADPQAVDWMSRTSAFTGKLVKPHLTVHTTGDALIPVQAENAYARAATAGGSAPLLRQAYVDNAGHCTFSTGEQVAALDALEERITSGRWHGTDPKALNARAATVDPATPAHYVSLPPDAVSAPLRPGPSRGPAPALTPALTLPMSSLAAQNVRVGR
jgi:pimeloyl-ACP methyl ester carboxylesterase